MCASNLAVVYYELFLFIHLYHNILFLSLYHLTASILVHIFSIYSIAALT